MPRSAAWPTWCSAWAGSWRSAATQSRSSCRSTTACGYDQVSDLQPAYHDLWVPWADGEVHCTVWFGFVHGRKCFFIEPHDNDGFFNRGAFYGFPDESQRFAFFSKAALEFLLKAGKRPDIIHTHDWQTGLVPVLLYEIYERLGMDRQRVCHTIHNFAHQGVVGGDDPVGDGPRAAGALLRRRPPGRRFESLARSTSPRGPSSTPTSSPPSRRTTPGRCAHTDQGFGLGHVLHLHQRKFGGVLNGLDYEMWNPETRSLHSGALRRGDDRAAQRQHRGPAPALPAAGCGEADRRLRRPTRRAEGRPPDPARAFLHARAEAASSCSSAPAPERRHQRRVHAPAATTCTTIPTAISRSASTRSWRI